MRLQLMLLCWSFWTCFALAYRSSQQQQQASSLFESPAADQSLSAGSFTVRIPNSYANEVPIPPAAPPSNDFNRYSKAVLDKPRNPTNTFSTAEQKDEERYVIMDASNDEDQPFEDAPLSLFDDQASEISYVSLPASSVSLFDDTPDAPAVPNVIVNNYNGDSGAQRPAAPQAQSDRGDIYISVHSPSPAPAPTGLRPAPFPPSSDASFDTSSKSYAPVGLPAGPPQVPSAPPTGKYQTQYETAAAPASIGPPAIPNDVPAQAAPFFAQSQEGGHNKVSLTWSQFDATLTPSTDVGRIISSITNKGNQGSSTSSAPLGPSVGPTTIIRPPSPQLPQPPAPFPQPPAPFPRPPAPQIPQPPAPPQDFEFSFASSAAPQSAPPQHTFAFQQAASPVGVFVTSSSQTAPSQSPFFLQQSPPAIQQAPSIFFQQAAPATGTYGSNTNQAAPPSPTYVLQQSAPPAPPQQTYVVQQSDPPARPQPTYTVQQSDPPAPPQPTYVLQQSAPPAPPQQTYVVQQSDPPAPPQPTYVVQQSSPAVQQAPSSQYGVPSSPANPTFVYPQAPPATPPSTYNYGGQANSPPSQNQPVTILLQSPPTRPQNDGIVYNKNWTPTGPNSPQVITGSGYEVARPPPPSDESNKGGHTYNYYYILNKDSNGNKQRDDPLPPSPPLPHSSSYGNQMPAQTPSRNPSSGSYGTQQSPPQNPSQSYGSPQSPPQNPSNSYGTPQSPPQNPSNSYGAPQSPPQNPSNSYGTPQSPPQNPTNSYGLQAPPQNPSNFNSYSSLSSPPAQSDFSNGYGSPPSSDMSMNSYLPVRDPPSMSYGAPPAPPVRDPPSSSYGAPPAIQPIRNPPSSSYGVPQAPVQSPSLSYAAPQFTTFQDDEYYVDEEDEQKDSIFDKFKEIKIFKASKSKGKSKGKYRRPVQQQQAPQQAPMSYGYGNRPSSPPVRDPVIVSSPNLNVNYQYQYSGPPIVARPASKKGYKKLFYKGTLAMGGLGLLPNSPGVLYRRKRRDSPFFGKQELNETYGHAAPTPNHPHTKLSYKRLSNGTVVAKKSLFDDLPFQGAPIPAELREELKEYLPSEEILSDAQCLQKTFCTTLVKLGDTEYRKSFLLFYSALSPDADENEWIKESLTAAKKNACDEFYCLTPDAADNDLDEDKDTKSKDN